MPIAAPSAGDRILNTDLAAFYNLLKGVAGSGEAITLVYNAAGVIAFIPSSDPSATTQLFQIKNAASTVKSALTAGGGAVFSSVINTAKSADIASSGTTDLSTATGNYAQISGTTTITAFGTVQAGTVMVLEFQGILTLTHNATSLILRAGANATTAAGDIYLFVSEGSGNWREISHLVAAAAASDFVQLSQTVLGSANTTFTFSSISASYRNLEIRLQGRGDAAATLINVQMQFNADTGANYDDELAQFNADTTALGPASGGQHLAATFIIAGSVAAASSSANTADSIRISIDNYVGAVFHKSAICDNTVKLGTAAGNVYRQIRSGWWRSTAAITSITLTASSGNFVTGSVATLYGLR